MECVYFLISVIEIILTVWLVFVFARANSSIKAFNKGLQEKEKNFNQAFFNLKKILSFMPKVLKGAKKAIKLKNEFLEARKLKKIILLVFGAFYVRKHPEKFFKVFKKIVF